MKPSHVLHAAPDNASLIAPFALGELGVAYRTQSVSRGVVEQIASVVGLCQTDGMVEPPFTNPDYPNPPEGSAF